MSKKIKMISSFFYLGHSPFMPGTLGSLAGLVVYFLVKDREVLYASMIIIDEVCGMLLALFFIPYNLFIVILGFFLFRIFDILKPPPARRMEKLTGSLGIMFDDVVAALYTNFILQIITRVLPYCKT
jgi:phosphatidylglycerophosphatase A